MAADKRYHTFIKVAVGVQMLIGGGFVAFWLWDGRATIPRHGGGWLTLDRAEQPYLYWSLVIAIALALIWSPIRYLLKGPPQD